MDFSANLKFQNFFVIILISTCCRINSGYLWLNQPASSEDNQIAMYRHGYGANE